MTFKQLWEMYTAGNPHWLTEGANLTADGVRKLVERTYNAGHAQGVENGKAAEAMRREESAAKSRDLLSRIGNFKPF